MVRVLASGEVVGDDEPRNRGDAASRAPRQSSPRQNVPQQQAGAGGGDGLASIWLGLNERLRGFGLNSFQIAGYTVDPAHIVVAVLALIMLGPMALIAVVILVAVTQDRNVTTDPGSSSQNPFSRPPSAYTDRPSTSADVPKKSSTSRNNAPFSGTGQKLGS